MFEAQNAALREVMLALSDLFAEEGRAGGDVASQCLREAADGPLGICSEAAQPAAKAWFGQAASAPDCHPIVRLLQAAGDAIVWTRSGARQNAIPGRYNDMFFTAYLMGHRSGVPCRKARAGLFMQTPNVLYPQRRHLAEETYFVLSGISDWQLGDGPFVTRCAGEFSHHPSNVLHSTRTLTSPLLTAWRLTGEDLEFTSYKLIENAA